MRRWTAPQEDERLRKRSKHAIVVDTDTPPDTHAEAHRRLLEQSDLTRHESTSDVPRHPSQENNAFRGAAEKPPVVRSLMERLRSASLSITWSGDEQQSRPSRPNGFQQAFRSAWRRAVALTERHSPRAEPETRPVVIRTPMEAFLDKGVQSTAPVLPASVQRSQSMSGSASPGRPTASQARGQDVQTPPTFRATGPIIIKTVEEAFSTDSGDPAAEATVSRRPAVRLKRSLTLPPLRIATPKAAKVTVRATANVAARSSVDERKSRNGIAALRRTTPHRASSPIPAVTPTPFAAQRSHTPPVSACAARKSGAAGKSVPSSIPTHLPPVSVRQGGAASPTKLPSPPAKRNPEPVLRHRLKHASAPPPCAPPEAPAGMPLPAAPAKRASISRPKPSHHPARALPRPLSQLGTVTRLTEHPSDPAAAARPPARQTMAPRPIPRTGKVSISSPATARLPPKSTSYTPTGKNDMADSGPSSEPFSTSKHPNTRPTRPPELRPSASHQAAPNSLRPRATPSAATVRPPHAMPSNTVRPSVRPTRTSEERAAAAPPAATSATRSQVASASARPHAAPSPTHLPRGAPALPKHSMPPSPAKPVKKARHRSAGES